MRLPYRNFNDVLNGTASYHEIFQHRYLSIVSSWRKGLTFVLGEIDLPPYPFVRYYFDWGVGSPRLTYIWPLIVFTASTLGAFVMRGIQKIVSYLIVLRIPEKLCGFGYQSRNSVDGLFNDKCKTLTSSMVDGCINVATIQNWE